MARRRLGRTGRPYERGPRSQRGLLARREPDRGGVVQRSARVERRRTGGAARPRRPLGPRDQRGLQPGRRQDRFRVDRWRGPDVERGWRVSSRRSRSAAQRGQSTRWPSAPTAAESRWRAWTTPCESCASTASASRASSSARTTPPPSRSVETGASSRGTSREGCGCGGSTLPPIPWVLGGPLRRGVQSIAVSPDGRFVASGLGRQDAAGREDCDGSGVPLVLRQGGAPSTEWPSAPTALGRRFSIRRIGRCRFGTPMVRARRSFFAAIPTKFRGSPLAQMACASPPPPTPMENAARLERRRPRRTDRPTRSCRRRLRRGVQPRRPPRRLGGERQDCARLERRRLRRTDRPPRTHGGWPSARRSARTWAARRVRVAGQHRSRMEHGRLRRARRSPRPRRPGRRRFLQPRRARGRLGLGGQDDPNLQRRRRGGNRWSFTGTPTP